MIKQKTLIIAGIVLAGVMFLRPKAQFIGGISASSPRASGGADGMSAMPRGYRSDPPNNPYTGNSQ